MKSLVKVLVTIGIDVILMSPYLLYLADNRYGIHYPFWILFIMGFVGAITADLLVNKIVEDEY